MQSLSNYQWHFFSHRIRTKILQFEWKHKRLQIAKVNLRKKNGAGGIRHLNFGLYDQATVIKAVWYWNRNRNIGQWNRVESTEVNLCTYGTSSMIKEARIYSGEKTRSSISSAAKTVTCKRIKLEYFLTPYTKTNSKWI